jgi:hypothetical protein
MRLVLMTLAMLALISAPAFAQGGNTSSIGGVVVDESGGTIPGANVLVKNVATGVTFDAVSGAQGAFNIPVVPTGTYSVTVSLDGFKTAVYNDIVVSVAGPANVRAELEVGAVTETVTVEAAGAIVQTQSTTISSTISTKQIENLPLTSRSVLDFVINLPGVNTPGGSRQSTINGLQRGSINITLDGINIQDNTLKSNDGFFAIVNPRLDAIEEVTVSSAAQTADAAGTGAVQIKFVTRGGSNSYTGSVYHYYRNDALNANTYFNKRDGVDKPEQLQNQPGFRVGGPIVLPGLFDGHNRAFFFVNYEEFRQPQSITRTRTIFSPNAQQGLFEYGAGRSVDLMALAAANGLTSTIDPTIRQLLVDIRAAASTTGSIDDLVDPTLQRYRFNVDQRSHNRFPTVRVDVNVSERHRVSGSVNYQRFLSIPDTLNQRDPRFPGFPVTATQGSQRLGISTSLRSTLGANVVNELRVGGSGAPVQFFDEMSVDMFNGPIANQAGFRLDFPRITEPSTVSNKQSRNAYTWLVENTLNWQRGSHGLNIGGSYSEVRVWLKSQNLTPEIDFGLLQTDPARDLFTSANFPGSSQTDRNNAEATYSLLIGAVSQIGATAAINPSSNQFEYLRETLQEGRLRDMAFWFQDAWRPRPDLTINLGVRWELQTPFQALNDSYSITTLEDAWGISGLAPTCTNASAVNPTDCNLFKPGFEPGKPVTEYFPLSSSTDVYTMDWDNIAPSVGAAWTPTSEGTGWLASFLGQPGDTVFRAGWSRAFQRNGMSDFTGRIGNNPGLTTTATRNQNNTGNLNLQPGILLRQPALLGPPADFPMDRIFPLTDVETGNLGLFDPDLQVPYADTWSAGWQRSISRNMAVEVRYVGTRSRDLWGLYNYNEINIHENGVLGEFLLAQQNLQANIAAGRGGNFRYFGPGTGTNPLPIALAYFSGRTDAGNAAAYGSGFFANNTFLNPLATFDPNPFTFANNLDGTPARRANALAAGLPSNFLVANPNKLGGANVTGNGGFTKYNSLQIELRRRLAQGLSFQTSYVFGQQYLSNFFSFRVPRQISLDPGSPGNVTHAWKANWTFELPFGQGRRFGSNVGPVLDRIIGGWQVHGITRIQSGATVNFGNVRIVGFTKDDLRDLYFHRIDADGRVTMLPEDVIENTIKAFSVSPTSATGYSALGPPEGRYFAPADGPDCIETISSTFGDCGQGRNLILDAPLRKQLDLSIVKLVPIVGRVRAEFRVEMLNALDVVNFGSVTGLGDDPDDYEVNGLSGTPSSRVIQLVSRITW